MIGEWEAQVVSQEIAGVTGKFGLGVQNEAGQMLTSYQTSSSNNTRDDAIREHRLMVNSEI